MPIHAGKNVIMPWRFVVNGLDICGLGMITACGDVIKLLRSCHLPSYKPPLLREANIYNPRLEKKSQANTEYSQLGSAPFSLRLNKINWAYPKGTSMRSVAQATPRNEYRIVR